MGCNIFHHIEISDFFFIKEEKKLESQRIVDKKKDNSEKIEKE